MKSLASEFRPALGATLALAVLTCGAYPLLVTGMARVAFKWQASGSLVTEPDGRVVGSVLLGQAFNAPHYFHPRPSAAGAGYDASGSGGSNLGPASRKLHDAIVRRLGACRGENQLEAGAEVPADAVTASGSGLDPHISVRNAEMQAGRIAASRRLSLETVRQAIAANTDHPDLGFLGEARVNVLKLNLALDAAK